MADDPGRHPRRADALVAAPEQACLAYACFAWGTLSQLPMRGPVTGQLAIPGHQSWRSIASSVGTNTNSQRPRAFLVFTEWLAKSTSYGPSGRPGASTAIRHRVKTRQVEERSSHASRVYFDATSGPRDAVRKNSRKFCLRKTPHIVRKAGIADSLPEVTG